MPGQNASLWTTGPAAIYVQPGTQPLFFGTARVKPIIEIIPEWTPFYSDELGRKTPATHSFDMEHAIITAEVNRFSESAYELLTVAKYGGGATPPGQYSFEAMGTMIIPEGFQMPLWIVFPYSTLTSFNGMPAGYHFPAVEMLGPERFTDLGSSDRAIALAWHATPVQQEGDVWTLYDFNVGGLPAPS